MIRRAGFYAAIGLLLLLNLWTHRWMFAAPNPEPLASYASVKQLMIELTVPLSNTVFAAAGEAPKDEAGWQLIHQAALALGQSAELLTKGPLAIHDPAWQQPAKDMADAAQNAAKAAKLRDVDAIAAAGDALYQSCVNCHKSYLKMNSGAIPKLPRTFVVANE